MKKDRGFTIVELMITLLVASIIMAFAMPSFLRMVQDFQVSSQANILLGSLQMARSEAVKRGMNVNIAAASGTDFATGWCIYTSTSCSGNNIIRQHEAAGSITTSPAAALTFSSTGQLGASYTFEITPQNCKTGDMRKKVLTMTAVGRGNVATTACS